MADRSGEEDTPSLSEHGLIARYFAPLAADFPGAHGLKDDAAVLSPPPGADLVITADALIAGVHFFADDAPGDIAWKALAVNVSDLAAKGAVPLAYSLVLALPSPPSEPFLAGFAAGLGEAQRRFGIALSGGDTCATPGPLTISVTAFGTVPQGRTVRRTTAAAGDSLYVSGTIGDAALGLKLRRGDAEAQSWPLSEEARAFLVSRYLLPEPRTALTPVLLQYASAAMDISDGLIIDCGRICNASGVGAVIEAALVPLSSAAHVTIEANADLLGTAFTGGDDYEILLSVRAGEESAFETAAAATGIPVTKIGSVRAGDAVVAVNLTDGSPLALGDPGYDHFRP